MKFLDINTFFSPKAGGIRTFHREKILYFLKHPEHDYSLYFPGPCNQSLHLCQNVHLEMRYGIALTSDHKGYRLLLDYVSIASDILKTNPNIVEVGDPWISTLFACVFKPIHKLFNSKHSILWTSFWHSDPGDSYLKPWANRGYLKWFKKCIMSAVNTYVFNSQKCFDVVECASKSMEQKLKKNKISAAHLPFGCPPEYLNAGKIRDIHTAGAKTLLYAGRLDKEKGFLLLLDTLSVLCKNGYTISIAGRGALEGELQKHLPHPQIHYLGYISSSEQLCACYTSHRYVLFPGPHETFGLGALEALACGCIPIGNPYEGIGELLNMLPHPQIYHDATAKDFVACIDGATQHDPHQLSSESIALACQFGTWENAIHRLAQHSIDVYQKLGHKK